jgi:chromosome segregation ATPase
MDARAVLDLADLAAGDALLAAQASELRQLDVVVAELRARAETVDAFFAAYSNEQARRSAAVADAEARLSRRSAGLAEAQAQYASAREDEARERAQHLLDRARDHVAIARESLERARSDSAALEREASRLSEEVPLLEERAQTVAAGSEHLPSAPAGVRELVEWASRAHAELFVAQGYVDAQRERVVREANELATMLLGEPTYGATVAQLAAKTAARSRQSP